MVVLHAESLRAALDDYLSLLESRLGSIVHAQRKNALSTWWLEFVIKAVDGFLEECGYIADAVPSNYTDVRPGDMDLIAVNADILADALEPGNEAVMDLVDEVVEQVYTIVDEFMEDIESALQCDWRALLGDEGADSCEVRKASLQADLAYLQRMRSMDRGILENSGEKGSTGESTARKITMSDVVPIGGLVMGRFHMYEVEILTVMEMWQERPPNFVRLTTPSPTPSPTPSHAPSKRPSASPLSPLLPPRPVGSAPDMSLHTRSYDSPSRNNSTGLLEEVRERSEARGKLCSSQGIPMGRVPRPPMPSSPAPDVTLSSQSSFTLPYTSNSPSTTLSFPVGGISHENKETSNMNSNNAAVAATSIVVAEEGAGVVVGEARGREKERDGMVDGLGFTAYLDSLRQDSAFLMEDPRVKRRKRREGGRKREYR